MTYEEAIKVIKNNYPKTAKMVNGRYKGGFDDTESKLGQALNMAIEVLEKQIPKKPILKDRTEVIHLNKGDKPHEWREVKRQDWVCPVCGCFVGQGHNAFQIKPHDQRKCNYCNECGQAINWEGAEENE